MLHESTEAACACSAPTPIQMVRFIDPLRTDVDAAIHEAQRCIVEALDLDGSTLFELRMMAIAPHPRLVASRSSSAARTPVGQGEFPVDGHEAPGWRAGMSVEPRGIAGRGRPRELASLQPEVDRRGPAVDGAADRRRRELRRDAARAAVVPRDSPAHVPCGEHVRRRARPSAPRRGATPGARPSGTLERAAPRR